jgi:chemotaxis protein MotB
MLPPRAGLRRFHRPKKVSGDSGSWAVSYVDLLTLLLCFFIVFFNADKINAKSIVLTDVEQKLKDGGDLVFSSPIEKIQKTFADQKQISSSVNGASLFIAVGGESSYESGALDLNRGGLKRLLAVIKSLEPYKTKIRVTIIAQTDPVLVRKKDGRAYADNWDLSALRATHTLKFFAKAGFQPENLSATGVADGGRVPASNTKERTFMIKIDELPEARSEKGVKSL